MLFATRNPQPATGDPNHNAAMIRRHHLSQIKTPVPDVTISVPSHLDTGWLMDRVVQYREKAAECRQLAQSFSDDHLRNHYLQVAEAWEKLASESERLRQTGEQLIKARQQAAKDEQR